MSLILPSYQSGFAPRDYEPAYPSLWQGCVGAWAPCLGPTGLVLRDNSGQGNHGVLTGMDPGTDWVVSGGKYALDFDGSNDYVTGSANGLKIDAPITVSLFCYLRSIPTNNSSALVDIKASSGYCFVFEIVNFGGFTYLFTDGVTVSNNITISGSEIPTLNQWNHLSLSFLGNSYRFTINGRIAKQGTILGLQTRSTTTIDIGRRSTGITGYSDCQLDDIRIYNRALSDNEIRLLASRRGIGYDFKTHRSYSKTQSSGLRKKILTGLP